MSTTRAIVVGLMIGILPVIVVLAATSGFASTSGETVGSAAATDDLSARLDPARVDEQLARYAATPAGPATDSVGARGGPPASRTATTTRPAAPTPGARTLVPAQAAPPIAGQSPEPPALLPAPRKARLLGAAVPPAVRRWEGQIVAAATRTGLDPNLLAALMMTESGGSPDATSAKGAVGLMQIMGGPREPAANVEQGATILAGHFDRYGRNDLAIAAYNAGAGAVDQHGGVPPYRETRDLVFRVLIRYELYSR